MGLLDKYFAAKGSSAGKVKDVWTKIPAKAQTKEGDIPNDITVNSGTGTNFFDGTPRSANNTAPDEFQTGFVPNVPGTIPPGTAEGLDSTKTVPETTATLGASRWKGSALGYAFRDPKSGIASLYNFFKTKGARSADEVYHQYAPLEGSTYVEKLPASTQSKAKSDTVVSTPSA